MGVQGKPFINMLPKQVYQGIIVRTDNGSDTFASKQTARV